MVIRIYISITTSNVNGLNAPTRRHRLEIASSTREQTAEARKTTILQPVEQKPHSQKDRKDEKKESYVLDEGTR